jgi:hypothetical protein
LGKDESAAVWWSAAADDAITSWEIHRYRKDRSRPNGEWLYKGFIASSAAMVKSQVIVNNLTNDYEYRFTVKSGNMKGMSLESTPSNPGTCMVIDMVRCVYFLISTYTMPTAQ